MSASAFARLSLVRRPRKSYTTEPGPAPPGKGKLTTTGITSQRLVRKLRSKKNHKNQGAATQPAGGPAAARGAQRPAPPPRMLKERSTVFLKKNRKEYAAAARRGSREVQREGVRVSLVHNLEA